MPKKIELKTVLKTLYEERGLNRITGEYLLSYQDFLSTMLGTGIISTETTSRLKYKQVVCAGYARVSYRGTSIVLDVPKIRTFLRCERLIPYEATHTQTTHTQTTHTDLAEGEGSE